MTQKIYIVEGRQFRTEADYQNALKDQQVIENLRMQTKKMNLSDQKKLLEVIRSGKCRFHSILGQDNQMTDDEIQKRMEELSYLKIQPRDLEENRLVLLRAERMYEEALGDRRKELDRYITVFEAALKKGETSAAGGTGQGFCIR